MKHFSTFNHTARRLRHNIIPGVLIAGTLSFMISCSTENDPDTPTPVISNSERMGISETEPVERDWDAIQEEGVLRMVTRFNSSSYFLHRGEEKGFEYEFARAFAKAHDLDLEVVIVGNDDHPIDILNSGKGDFIAANYSITPERDEFIDFTASYNEVNQVLVFPRDRQGDIPASLEEAAGIEISVRSGSSYATTLRELKETHGYSYTINELPGMWDAEAIMFALADGEFEATVADENLFRATSNYIDG
ncbi:MAG: transporter substrate-binding domain-containing protein, partial [Cyclonatronaceae bacterium]